MIRYAVRAGVRAAARSRPSGPKGPPKPWPVPVRIAVAAVIIWTWARMDWHSLVITAVIGVVLTGFCAMCGSRKTAAPKRDPLDELMDKYRKDENR
jgi:hypothetical protein